MPSHAALKRARNCLRLRTSTIAPDHYVVELAVGRLVLSVSPTIGGHDAAKAYAERVAIALAEHLIDQHVTDIMTAPFRPLPPDQDWSIVDVLD